MNDGIVLVTKDAMCKSYLPVYGNQIWKGLTPNIDSLAENGTVFHRHITAAPSTVMAFRSMVTGRFPYGHPFINYQPKEIDSSPLFLFESMENAGYKGHIIWDKAWDNMVLRYGNCYGKNTTIHSLEGLRQGVGCHYHHKGTLRIDDDKTDNMISIISKEISLICNSDNKVFLWIHLPHVLNGRTAYGGDIDVFDNIIGIVREYFHDENIFISSDHGNMNGYSGKFCYGFDVHSSAAEIPLITPRIQDHSRIDYLTSNVDIKSIIMDRTINKRETVYCDSAYYGQKHRKLAVYSGDFVYIYEKKSKKEFIYDVINDPFERINLLKQVSYDVDRKLKSPVCEYYYSPYWEQMNGILDDFRNKRDAIWRNASFSFETKENATRWAKTTIVALKLGIKGKFK